MTPTLNGIDHVHVYVANWGEAEKWYESVLGFKRVEKFMVWAVGGGPLTLENAEGDVHVALFEREDHPDTSAIAFGATGAREACGRLQLFRSARPDHSNSCATWGAGSPTAFEGTGPRRHGGARSSRSRASTIGPTRSGKQSRQPSTSRSLARRIT